MQEKKKERNQNKDSKWKRFSCLGIVIVLGTAGRKVPSPSFFNNGSLPSSVFLSPLSLHLSSLFAPLPFSRWCTLRDLSFLSFLSWERKTPEHKGMKEQEYMHMKMWQQTEWVVLFSTKTCKQRTFRVRGDKKRRGKEENENMMFVEALDRFLVLARICKCQAIIRSLAVQSAKISRLAGGGDVLRWWSSWPSYSPLFALFLVLFASLSLLSAFSSRFSRLLSFADCGLFSNSRSSHSSLFFRSLFSDFSLFFPVLSFLPPFRFFLSFRFLFFVSVSLSCTVSPQLS